MRQNQRHSFSMIIRDLLRNARSLIGFLRAEQGGGHSSAHYYPSLFDSSTQVRNFYAQKAKDQGIQQRSTQGSETASVSAKVKTFNNLVKILLIEEFVDKMPTTVRVLDLGCGHGQDLNK